jgi:2,3-bisphosphoglycerate-independent phosphoglycerate mutase
LASPIANIAAFPKVFGSVNLQVKDWPLMKYVIVIPDGAADEPQESLSGATPLEAAKTPNLDRLAQLGCVGRANHTPRQLPAGSDVANLSLLGFDPVANYSGRAPIEAAAKKIPLGDNDWVVRCNLVTVVDQVMQDFTAGHISTEEATELLAAAQSHLPAESPLRFFPGVSYRNLLVYRPASDSKAPFSRDTRATPPHDLTDREVTDDFPRGPGSDLLCDLMGESVAWFAKHPVNERRIANGKRPASNVWLWGLGKKPRLGSFRELYGIRGAMITAVDLLRGLAELVGWENITVPGATGYLDTDYAAKGQAAIAALQKFDLVCVHIEAPDEAAHQGDVAAKIAAIEAIDHKIVGPVLEALQSRSEWRMLVTPDHPTPCRTKTHSHGDVPFVVAGSRIAPDKSQAYGETAAAASELAFPLGFELMSWFLKKS